MTDGIAVQPLQIPELSPPADEPITSASSEEPDPATWDRSALPAGACVFHLSGVCADCYPDGGTFYVGACVDVTPAGPNVAPGSFYNGHSGVTPGCPSAADAHIWAPGYWWYLVNRGDGADLVVCSPECVNSFAYGGCLKLRADSPGACGG